MWPTVIFTSRSSRLGPLFEHIRDARDEAMKMMQLFAVLVLSFSVILLGTPAAAQTPLGRGALTGNNISSDKDRKDWKPSVLVVVTNFGKAEVKVNGLDYPEYVNEPDKPGMVLPAGGPYTVEVSYDGNTKVYRLYLKAYETRYLMVDLSGFNGAKVAAAPQKLKPRPKPKEKEDDESDKGRVTVYSKPSGTIMVDGKNTGEDSPGTVDVEPGRHQVQVRFGDGKESERKIVRVRKGSRIKLFFRDNK